VPINFPDQWALTSWGNLISHYTTTWFSHGSWSLNNVNCENMIN
jgi:hypothetical protein